MVGSGHRIRRGRRWAAIVAVLGGALALVAGVANASVTTPSAGSTVRGDVLISENQGGRKDGVCSSSGVDGIITVFKGSPGVQIFQANKGSAGSWSTTWVSHGFARGTYRILSQSKDRFFGSIFNPCQLTTATKSDFTVTLDNLSRTTYTGATSAFYGESFTASANLKDSISSRNIAGRTLTFQLSGGGSAGACVTDGAGNCSATLSANVLPGAYTISASFAEDCCWRASTASPAFTVLKRPTKLTYSGDVVGTFDEDVTLSAGLGDSRLSGAALPGKLITFDLKDGASVLQSATAMTDGDGFASTPLHLNVPGGNYTIEASFAGDAVYLGGSNSSAFTVLRRASMIGYNGDLDGYWTEDATASGTLLDAVTGAPISGRSVAFAIGSGTGSGTTDAVGFASDAITLGDAPGTYPATAIFAGDPFFLPSNSTGSFLIKKRPSSLAYDGATSGPHNGTATLSATLTDTRNGGGVSGKTVHFSLGTYSADAVTNASGAASVVAPMNQDAGAYTVSAGFDEDGFYLASSDSESFTIGWEYTFVDGVGNGSVFINTSNKQFGIKTADGFDAGVVNDPGMQIISVPDGFEPPNPGPPPEIPECVDDPTGGGPVCPGDYVPPLGMNVNVAGQSSEDCIEDPNGGDPICPPEPPALPCDPNAPEGCVPPVEPPCDPNSPEGCVPPVEPPCDPNAPEGCVPPPPPPPCDPNAPEGCVPPPPPPPCNANDPQTCLPQPLPSLCEAPGATGCHERFVTIAYNGETFAIAGVFDLDTHAFVAVVRTPANGYLLAHVPTPEPPCDPNAPEGCLPPVEPPPVEPPPVEPPPVEPPSCVDNPLGDPICP